MAICQGCCGNQIQTGPALPVYLCGQSDHLNASRDVEQKVFCDELAGGATIPFLRHYRYDSNGSIINSWITKIDGITPYILNGVERACGGSNVTLQLAPVQTVNMVDVGTDGAFVPFLRHYKFDEEGDFVSFVDTLLDGETEYTPAGTVTVAELLDTVRVIPVTSGSGKFDLAASSPQVFTIPANQRQLEVIVTGPAGVIVNVAYSLTDDSTHNKYMISNSRLSIELSRIEPAMKTSVVLTNQSTTHPISVIWNSNS